ncbi:hypothetical protein ASD83_04970 [Devosia sp. Root685]|nr:hypothetical protein ASD83_04970 [Devosia sp. Root685]
MAIRKPVSTALDLNIAVKGRALVSQCEAGVEKAFATDHTNLDMPPWLILRNEGNQAILREVNPLGNLAGLDERLSDFEPDQFELRPYVLQN